MPTELHRIDLNTAVRFGFVLGVVGGLLGMVPAIWAGIQYEWATLPFGRIALDALAAIILATVGTAFGVAVVVAVYNTVARYFGGIEFVLSE